MNTCATKEIEQLLSSPRLHHRARDVSMFLSPLPADRHHSYKKDQHSAENCVFHHGDDGCMVDRVHGFDIILDVHSSRKD